MSTNMCCLQTTHCYLQTIVTKLPTVNIQQMESKVSWCSVRRFGEQGLMVFNQKVWRARFHGVQSEGLESKVSWCSIRRFGEQGLMVFNQKVWRARSHGVQSEGLDSKVSWCSIRRFGQQGLMVFSQKVWRARSHGVQSEGLESKVSWCSVSGFGEQGLMVFNQKVYTDPSKLAVPSCYTFVCTVNTKTTAPLKDPMFNFWQLIADRPDKFVTILYIITMPHGCQ